MSTLLVVAAVCSCSAQWLLGELQSSRAHKPGCRGSVQFGFTNLLSCNKLLADIVGFS